MPTDEIVSFGYLHAAPPPSAHLTVDLRAHCRDPHVDPGLRHMTAHDEPVRAAVLGTPGIPSLIQAAEDAVMAMLAGPSATTVTIAFGCAGGRHRAPTVAQQLTARLRARGVTARLRHRDLDKPVIARAS